MTDTVSEQPAPMKDWAPWQHTEMACSLLEQFTADRHPQWIALAQAHAAIAHVKMLGGLRA
jgi:hypothetical protein